MMVQKIIIVDLKKCMGDRQCVVACSFAKEKLFGLTKGRIFVLKDESQCFSMPVLCEHCENPPCQIVCPVRAISKDPETGIVRINYDRCIGCKECMWVCPFGVVTIDLERHQVVKCDLCDGDPLCVKFCIGGALQYVRADRSATIQKKQDLVERRTKALVALHGH